MTAHRLLPGVLVLALLVSACNGSGDDVQVFGGSTDVVNNRITLHDGLVSIKASGAPDATVDQAGQLIINNQPVAVNDAQRALLQRYNGAARQMREDAIATGKAGVATATKELGAVAGKMTGATTSEQASQQAEEASRAVELAAARICDDIASMKSAQDDLAGQLDAFKPYAQALTDENVEKCHKGTRPKN
ncbi:DUF2884 family protein [Dyella sp. C11]|uniref:DUF2884 family protein n=1 Tax=Dyella sp. C11 TaxID=2126991 RepID=UPI000D65C861|nr:DUF2884 family protein [Dyella sp. C11]